MTGSFEKRAARKASLIIFVKDPVPGRVKTRLAGEIGEQAAAEIYQGMILDLFENLRASPVKPVYYADREHPEFPPLAEKERNRELRVQSGTDLGVRMDNAFRQEFLLGAPAVILAGSDIPLFRETTVRMFLDMLEEHEAVIGPTFDGGYYSIGFRRNRYTPEVFHGIPWSTPGVYDVSMKILKKAGIKSACAPRMRDVDTLADLKTLVSIPHFRITAPETVRTASRYI